MRAVSRSNSGKSVLSNIVEAISSSDVSRDCGGITPVRGSVPSLKGIDDKYEKIMADVQARRKELTRNETIDQSCNKCLYLESSLQKLQDKRMANDEDSLSLESSVSVSVNKEKLSRRSKSRNESRKDVEKLCQKIEELVTSKDRHNSDVANMENKMKQYEQEIERLKIEMKQREEAFKVHQYEENIKNLNTIIENQSRKILELNTSLGKMKNNIVAEVLREKSEQAETKTDKASGNESTQYNPLGFLDSIRNNLISLEKEEKLVEDDLEELSISSLVIVDKDS